ncbi:MAG: hypothetical protein ABFD16_07060 [Thermoguttaceae bacterium]
METPRQEGRRDREGPLRPAPTPPRPELEAEEVDDDVTPSPNEQTDPDRGIGEMGTEGTDPMRPLPKP